MCSDEFEKSKEPKGGRLELQQPVSGATTATSTMLTPPWTPQFERAGSPPKVETNASTDLTQQTSKEARDKENQPSNMQAEQRMTYKEFKQKQNGGKSDHFRNLILSTDAVATCGKLVVDSVIESMYSQEFGKIEPKSDLSGARTVCGSTAVTATFTPNQGHAGGVSNGASKPGDVSNNNNNNPKFSVGMLHPPHPMPARSFPSSTPAHAEARPDGVNGKKTAMTFGEIQETLIRKAVESSYDFDIASGLKSENSAYFSDASSKREENSRKRDYSVFDFPSSDVGQNLVEMSSFESRIKHRKLDASKLTSSTAEHNFTKLKPSYTHASHQFATTVSSANRTAGPDQRSQATRTRLPEQQPMNRTAMELLQKCTELSRANQNPAVQVPTKTVSSTTEPSANNLRVGGALSRANEKPSNGLHGGSGGVTAAQAEVKRSPPVPLKKRKFLLPPDPSPTEEKPVVIKSR